MNPRITRHAAAITLSMLAASANAAVIEYGLSNISGDTWQYDYTLINDSTDTEIREFTVWFSQSGYSNLALETAPKGWDPVTWQPGSNAGLNPGGYDAMALTAAPLSPGDSLAGFSVRFDWSGTAPPGSQPFDIVDPSNYSVVLASGFTVQSTPAIPVPAALWLFASGLAALAAATLRRRQ